jgi:transposase
VESLQPGANVSEVARRNGLSPQQLFGWRREVRRGRSKQDHVAGAPSSDVSTQFAAVVVAASPALPSPAGANSSNTIEITISDAVVRVSGQIDVVHLAAVLRAVRRAS